VRHPSANSPADGLTLGAHEFDAHEGKNPDQYDLWSKVSDTRCAPPASLPPRFLVRPELRNGADSYFVSHAFVVRSENGSEPIILTALHTLDELIKRKGIDCTEDNRAYTGHELPRHIEAVQLYDLAARNWMIAELGAAGNMLVLPGARIGGEEPYSQRDIAAFRAGPCRSLTPIGLAGADPVVGEPISLVARGIGGTKPDQFPAVVVELTESTMIFRFQGQELPPHTSGAPLMNSYGDVVGINVGGGSFGGRLFGHANQVTSIRRHLGWS